MAITTFQQRIGTNKVPTKKKNVAENDMKKLPVNSGVSLPLQSPIGQPRSKCRRAMVKAKVPAIRITENTLILLKTRIMIVTK